MLTDITGQPTSYLLHLCDSLSWRLEATAEVHEWLERFAEIFRLPKCDSDCPRRILFFQDRWPPLPDYTIPDDALRGRVDLAGREDWGYANLRGLTLRRGHDKRETALGLIGPRSLEMDFIRMWRTSQVIFVEAMELGGLPLHAGLVALDGKGVALVGPGSSGKSTCCRRIPEPWESLADDEVLALPGKHEKFNVHPFPTWSEYMTNGRGRGADVMREVSLEAALFLEPSSEDRLVPLGRGEVAVRLFRSAVESFLSSWPEEIEPSHSTLRRIMFENASILAKLTPGFILRVSLEGPFWDSLREIVGDVDRVSESAPSPL